MGIHLVAVRGIHRHSVTGHRVRRRTSLARLAAGIRGGWKIAGSVDRPGDPQRSQFGFHNLLRRPRPVIAPLKARENRPVIRAKSGASLEVRCAQIVAVQDMVEWQPACEATQGSPRRNDPESMTGTRQATRIQ